MAFDICYKAPPENPREAENPCVFYMSRVGIETTTYGFKGRARALISSHM